MTDIRTPGTRSFKTRERSLREGVQIYDAIWDNFALLAKDLNVTVPPGRENQLIRTQASKSDSHHAGLKTPTQRPINY